MNPGFPDQPSGHTCTSGATVHALQAFFGTDRIRFSAICNKCSPARCPPRSFQRLSYALKEIIDASVLKAGGCRVLAGRAIAVGGSG